MMCQVAHITLLTCSVTTVAVMLLFNLPLSSNRQHYHTDDCLEDNKEDY